MRYDGILVGLGNPGQRYAGTRHNCGFLLARTLLEHAGQNGSVEALNGNRFACELWRLRLPDLPGTWLCAMPQTFMNASGQCVQPLLAWHRIAPQRLVVAHDELDIAPGALRFKCGGGNAGHNGLKSITEQLGTPDFCRLRLGIGRPHSKGDVIHWVLGKADAEDSRRIAASLPQALQVLFAFGRDGVQAASVLARSTQAVSSSPQR